MLRPLLSKLTANTAQVAVNQALSLLIFLLLARTLDKASFGLLNLALAILLVLFGILSFGMDQLLVRKTTLSGADGSWLSVVLAHYCLVGFVALLLTGVAALVGGATSAQAIVFALCAGKLAFSLSTPFKSVATAEERFGRVLAMSVVANTCRVMGLVLLWLLASITLQRACFVFVLADGAELLACLILSRRSLGAAFSRFSIGRYRSLLGESLPVVGTVVFSFALARFDWIFIGFFGTGARLAEYSFAYKVFELSLLPLYVIAPLLVPRFIRLAAGGDQRELLSLGKLEMLISGATIFVLNVVWEPAANFLSAGKYGSVNRETIFFLSLSIPFLYLNNFLWSLHFAAGRTRFILYSFAGCFAIDALLTPILYPLLGNAGAALAYLVAIALQTIAYYRRATEVPGLSWWPLLTGVFAALSGLAVSRMVVNELAGGLFGVSVFIVLLLLARRVRWMLTPAVSGF
ncbi:MAG: oligosaccharide flippase family protein [Flaviaesturariibacter sp.]|nr:oligosaccharide flippase family protein [Flaviaesturariibacter sp.]